jgi:hypothetical protein
LNENSVFRARTGETMEQLHVTREAIEAYERRTGFKGIGEHFQKKGLFVFLEEEQGCKTA